MGSSTTNRLTALAMFFLCVTLALAGLTLRRSSAPPVEVKTGNPAFRDIANQVTTNGIVQPATEFQARANFPGMVEKVEVSLGDKVRAGQLLVTMKDPFAVSRVSSAVAAVAVARESSQDVNRGGTQDERTVLSADYDHAKAARDSAQHQLDALRRLESQGAASAGEVSAAQQRLEDAGVTLEALHERLTNRYSSAARETAKDRLSDAQAALGAAKGSFDNANIAAPISGTVYSVSVSPYDFVPMGADLLRVTDLNKMQVRAYFDEPEVGKLKQGQEVTVTWDGRPGMTWHGHIHQAPVAAMPQGSRSVAECLITLDDSNGSLLPATHVLVTVSIDRHPHVLTLPRQALQTDAQNNWVYRVVDDRLERTPVRVGLVNLDWVEIVEGLSPQDTVALRTNNGQPLADNLKVIAAK